MFKVPVKVFEDVERISGTNERGPYDFRKQAAQINMPNGRSLPFEIFVDDQSGPLPAGDYFGILVPKLGRYTGSIVWEFKEFVPAQSK